MKVVYARADKVPNDCNYITQGRLYLVNENKSATMFAIQDDENATLMRKWGGLFGWTRIELPYRDPLAVEELIEVGKTMLPTGISLTNKNIPDDMNIPIDATMGELRAIAKALAALKGEPQ